MSSIAYRPNFAQIVTDLVELGLDRPIPAPPGTKIPYDKWKELQQRLVTAEESAKYAALHPIANALLICGEFRNRVVLEADDRDALEYLVVHTTETWTVLSSKGRAHLHFSHPGFRVKNSASEIYPNVDVRGDGGLIVAPGSVHRSGFVYRWAPGFSPRDVGLARLPEWAIEQLRPKPVPEREPVQEPDQEREIIYTGATLRALAALRAEAATVANTQKGRRNATLCRAAFNLGGLVATHELNRDEVVATLLNAAGPWDDSDGWRAKTLQTIEAAIERGMEHPRPPARIPV